MEKPSLTDIQWQLELLMRASQFLFDPSIENEADAQTRLAHLAIPELAEVCLVQRTYPTLGEAKIACAKPVDSGFMQALKDWTLLGQNIELENSTVYSSLLDLPAFRTLLAEHGNIDLSHYSCVQVPLRPRGKSSIGRMIFFMNECSLQTPLMSLRLAEEIANRGAMLIENITLTETVQAKVDELSAPMDVVLTTSELLRRKLHYHKENRNLSRLARSVRHSAEKIKSTLVHLSKAR